MDVKDQHININNQEFYNVFYLDNKTSSIKLRLKQVVHSIMIDEYLEYTTEPIVNNSYTRNTEV